MTTGTAQTVATTTSSASTLAIYALARDPVTVSSVLTAHSGTPTESVSAQECGMALVASRTRTHVTTDVTAVADLPTSTVPLASTTRTTTTPEPVSVTHNGMAKAASNGAESATRAALLVSDQRSETVLTASATARAVMTDPETQACVFAMSTGMVISVWITPATVTKLAQAATAQALLDVTTVS
jgi:hypothetical protein